MTSAWDRGVLMKLNDQVCGYQHHCRPGTNRVRKTSTALRTGTHISGAAWAHRRRSSLRFAARIGSPDSAPVLVPIGAGRMQSCFTRAWVTIALLCTTAATAEAQTPGPEPRVARLTGRVADALGYSIPKAEILVTNTTLHAESGNDGRFELAN